MNSTLVQYALFKTLYEKENNILDCFYPYFLCSIEEGKPIDGIDLQRVINEKYNIQIPIHVLNRLCGLAIERKHLRSLANDKTVWPVILEHDGDEYRDLLGREDEVERKINYLSDSINRYLSESGNTNEIDVIKRTILSFIEKNTEDIYSYFLGKEHNHTFRELTELEAKILEYCKISAERFPEEYGILNEIFLGSIYKSFLAFNEAEVEGFIDKKYGNCKIYFDANFLFSLLGYHDKEYSIPAKELMAILRENNFQFRVFDFTISEMAYVLKGYLKSSYKYPRTIKVNSLYSSLKRQGKTTADIIELIANLEANLKELKVFKKNTGIELDKYVPIDTDLNSIMWRAKPYQQDYYHNHDIALLEKAKSIRPNKIFRFEDALYYVVTSDFKLGKINHDEMGHKVDNSIDEMLLDRVLTNLLFMKKPSANVSLNSIISMFSRDMFVKRGVWEKFYDTLMKLKKEGKVDEHSIVNLFYQNQIEDTLRHHSETDCEDIDDEYVLEKVEEAAIYVEEQNRLEAAKHEATVARKEQEYSELFENEKSKAETAQYEEKIRVINVLDNDSKVTADRVILGFKIVLSALLAIPFVFIPIEVTNQNFKWASLMSIIRYLFFILECINLKISSIWDPLHNKIYEKERSKKLKKFGF